MLTACERDEFHNFGCDLDSDPFTDEEVLANLTENFPGHRFEIIKIEDCIIVNERWTIPRQHRIVHVETGTEFRFDSGDVLTRSPDWGRDPSWEFAWRYWGDTRLEWRAMFQEEVDIHLAGLYSESYEVIWETGFRLARGIEDTPDFTAANFPRIEEKRNTLTTFELFLEAFPEFETPNHFIGSISYNVFIEEFDMVLETDRIQRLFQAFILPIWEQTPGDFEIRLTINFVRVSGLESSDDVIFEYVWDRWVDRNEEDGRQPITFENITSYDFTAYFETREEQEERLRLEWEEWEREWYDNYSDCPPDAEC